MDEKLDDMSLKEDKIINNSYNTGEMEFEAFTSSMKIDDRVSSLYEDQHNENQIEVRTLKNLNEDIYSIFLESPFYSKYKNPKRVDKSDLLKMYYYFKDGLIPKKIYSPTQIFIAFAEFFQINYDILYSEIGVSDKEGLLREIQSHVGLKRKIRTKRLF